MHRVQVVLDAEAPRAVPARDGSGKPVPRSARLQSGPQAVFSKRASPSCAMARTVSGRRHGHRRYPGDRLAMADDDDSCRPSEGGFRPSAVTHTRKRIAFKKPFDSSATCCCDDRQNPPNPKLACSASRSAREVCQYPMGSRSDPVRNGLRDLPAGPTAPSSQRPALQSVSCTSAGPSRRELSEFQGVRFGLAMSPAPPSPPPPWWPLRRRPRVRHGAWRHTPAIFDLVDHLDLRSVGKLERCASCGQNHDLSTALAGVGLLLRHAERSR